MTGVKDATRSVVIERVMSHPPGKIWCALTQGRLIEEWLMKNDFQPVGYKFNFRAEPMPGWKGVWMALRSSTSSRSSTPTSVSAEKRLGGGA